MKVLVTGATGFLGGHLSEALLARGHEVRALVRASSKRDQLERLRIPCVEAVLEEGKGLDAALEGMDAVIHAAGIVKALSAEVFHWVNVDGTAHLLEASVKAGIKRFVLVSSLAAHGFRTDGKVRGLDEASAPVTLYGKSKRAGEEVTLRYADKLPVSILRPPAIYGPGDQEMFAFFQSIQRRVAPYLVNKDHALSLVYVKDCASAAVAILEQDTGSGHIYYAEDGAQHSQATFAAQIARELNVKPLPLVVPLPVLKAAAWFSERSGHFRGKAVMLTRDKVNELKQPYLICSADALKAATDWRPAYDLEKGVRETAAWYRQAGWL